MTGVLLYVLGGGAIGYGAGYAYALLSEVINFAWNFITCNCQGNGIMPNLWFEGRLPIFCAICGAFIGFIYGYRKKKMNADAEAAKRKAEAEAQARKQRAAWADGVKQKALTADSACGKNLAAFKPLVSAEYKAGAQMHTVMKELAKAAELQGKVDALAKDLSEKGGAAE